MATTQPTKEQWTTIEKALAGFYSRVILQVDGYEVTLALARVGIYKNAISVYVNGWLKGKWLLAECPERQRFFRPVTRNLYKGRDQAAIVKIIGRREAVKRGFYKKITNYHFDWTSFSRLKAHLIKHNESIELVKIGG